MERHKIASLLFGLLPLSIASSSEIPVSCMMEYENGGAPAVYESPECPEWVLFPKSPQNQTEDCQFATLRGRRKYQEDQVTCKLDMKVPILGKHGLEEEMVSVVAVFDGHGGKEVSEMASELLLGYFYLHIVFQSHQLLTRRKGKSPISNYKSVQLEILKEALSMTLNDIDLKVYQEAIEKDILSGSTAVVVLFFHGQILVANIGDSKALLFSENIQSGLTVEELTRDHHPAREDEKARIKAVGGSVTMWGLPRVNGVLAMSRSIGDFFLKRFGVISEPEFTGWRQLTANDKYLVVASDGIFESLTPQEVGNLIFRWDSHLQRNQKSELPSSCSSSSSLAECIVFTAYEKGSYDNLSAIVVPIKQNALSGI